MRTSTCERIPIATSGTVGLTGLGEPSLAPGEGQGRGFEHAHMRNTAYPEGNLVQRDILRAASASRRTRTAFVLEMTLNKLPRLQRV